MRGVCFETQVERQVLLIQSVEVSSSKGKRAIIGSHTNTHTYYLGASPPRHSRGTYTLWLGSSLGGCLGDYAGSLLAGTSAVLSLHMQPKGKHRLFTTKNKHWSTSSSEVMHGHGMSIDCFNFPKEMFVQGSRYGYATLQLWMLTVAEAVARK
eukprot:scaffold311783_cov21-Tisochrysis_lutea.AAC.1